MPVLRGSKQKLALVAVRLALTSVRNTRKDSEQLCTVGKLCLLEQATDHTSLQHDGTWWQGVAS